MSYLTCKHHEDQRHWPVKSGQDISVTLHDVQGGPGHAERPASAEDLTQQHSPDHLELELQRQLVRLEVRLFWVFEHEQSYSSSL